MPTPNELMQERASDLKKARDLVNLAEKEDREFSGEEKETYDKLWSRSEELRTRVERQEKLKAEEKRAAELVGEPILPDPAGGTEDRSHPRNTPEYRAAFNRFIRGGAAALSDVEVRALQADSDPAGGYLVAPQMFVNELIKDVDDAVFIRGLARPFTVDKAESLGVPAIDTDISDPAWTSELATGSEDTALDFAKRELYPHPLAKRIKVSNKLIRVSAQDPEAIVRERLAYKFGIAQENGFLNGSGSNQPLGVFTASALGISTSRDVSTGNTTTEMRFDGLIEAKYSVKGQYWNKAQFAFHRDGVKQIVKLKDGDGQYIWRESIRAGEPDRLLNLPVNMSEYVPNTFTTGLYVGIVGDWSCYWIADALDMQVQRLVELYAETNQTGFIGRMETDGMPVLEEAFARIKLA